MTNDVQEEKQNTQLFLKLFEDRNIISQNGSRDQGLMATLCHMGLEVTQISIPITAQNCWQP